MLTFCFRHGAQPISPDRGYTTGCAGKRPAERRLFFGPEPQPLVPDLVIVLVDIVELDGKSQVSRGQLTNLQGQVELGDGEVVLRGHQLDAVREELLLSVEHVDDGARP